MSLVFVAARQRTFDTDGDVGRSAARRGGLTGGSRVHRVLHRSTEKGFVSTSRVEITLPNQRSNSLTPMEMT